MKKGEQVPLKHGNDQLGFCLWLGGILPTAMLNWYDAPLLDKLNCPTVAAAQRLKRRGNVVYSYSPTPELAKLVGAYHAQETASKAGESVTLPKIEPEEAVRLMVHAQIMFKTWMNLAFCSGVMAYVERTGDVKDIDGKPIELGEERTVELGGYKIYSLNLSEEKRRQLENPSK